MSSTLYKEALLEVESLKRMAEENAKNKIIEAVTPQIRNLIEAQLLGEKKIEELDDVDDISDSAGEAEFDLAAITAPEPAPIAPAPQPEPVQAAPKIKIDVQGDLNIEMETEEDPEDLLLGQEVGDVVENYILGKRSSGFRIRQLAEKTSRFSKLIETINLGDMSDPRSRIALLYYAKLLDEAVSLAANGIIIEESVDLGLLSQLKTTIKEIRHMANRRDAVAFRRLLEELEADESLKEMIREEEGDAEEGAQDAPADVPPEAVEAAEDLQDDVENLLQALGLDDEGADDDDDDDDEAEADEEEADEEPLELGEADHDEADHDEADHDELDEVYEIDEAMLRRELLRMREGLEAEAGAAAANPDEHEHVGDPLEAQEDFGGSEEVLEVSEDDLVEALHMELNRSRRSRRPYRSSRRSGRSVAKLTEANKKLQSQLHEMNVFNAKLLFANKLMQNRDLTKKQQRAIVEALDSAKTVNEAKLLYKSLSKSVSTRGNISESKSRLLASSSRSTRSASAANNGVDGDRWAILAGLTEKNK